MDLKEQSRESRGRSFHEARADRPATMTVELARRGHHLSAIPDAFTTFDHFAISALM